MRRSVTKLCFSQVSKFSGNSVDALSRRIRDRGMRRRVGHGRRAGRHGASRRRRRHFVPRRQRAPGGGPGGGDRNPRAGGLAPASPAPANVRVLVCGEGRGSSTRCHPRDRGRRSRATQLKCRRIIRPCRHYSRTHRLICSSREKREGGDPSLVRFAISRPAAALLLPPLSFDPPPPRGQGNGEKGVARLLPRATPREVGHHRIAISSHQKDKLVGLRS